MKNEMEKDEWGSLFSQFWSTYPPRKGVRNGKKPCREKSWPRIKPKTIETFNKIIKAVNYFKTTEDWKKEDGKYIPMPTTFINQERWDIEFTDDMEQHIADTATPEPAKKQPVEVEKTTSQHTVEQAVETRKPDTNKTLRQQYLERLGYEEGL